MPKFDFICQKCNEKFEELILDNDKTKVKCPNCDSINVKKKFPAPNLNFKGSGFYETDYNNKKEDN